MKDYFKAHYDEKIERIKKINAPLNFIFYTDPHNRLTEWDCPKHKDYAPDDFELAVDVIESMKYITDKVKIDCLVCGGDIGNDYNTDPVKEHESFKEIMDALYSLPVPVHCCIGNHDDCMMTHYFEPEGRRPMQECILYPEDLHELCMKNNPTKENYYYTDFEELGYRFIFLNTSDFYYGFDEKGELIHPMTCTLSFYQIQWMKEALNTDKKVIVFSHAPISTKGIFGVPEITNGPWAWRILQKAPNVIAALSGHVHYDFLVYDQNIVNITTDAATGLEHGQWDPSCNWHEFGTHTESAFDVVSVTDKVIYLTRFGAGQDRVARIIRGYMECL